MEKAEIYAELPTVIHGVTVIPIVKATFAGGSKHRATSLFGLKRPIGIIVISPFFRKGFEINGKEVPPEQFIRDVPGLKTILENH